MIAVFEQRPNRLQNAVRAYLIKNGQVGLVDSRAADLSVDEIVSLLLSEIDRLDATRVVIDSPSQLVDSQQIEQLIEANQPLVLATFSARSDVERLQLTQAEQQLGLDMREANELLVIAALSAKDLQASAERTRTATRFARPGSSRTAQSVDAYQHDRGSLVRVPSQELPRMQTLLEGQVRRMSRLVEDLLDLARASTGKFRLEC